MSAAASGPVLVVDDEEDSRGIMAMLLEMEGYQVRQAADGVEALEVLGSQPRPCHVLMDLLMPRLDGRGVVRAMRASPDLADVPVVLLTGISDVDADIDELGVVAALTKPIDVDVLLEMIQVNCRRS